MVQYGYSWGTLLPPRQTEKAPHIHQYATQSKVKGASLEIVVYHPLEYNSIEEMIQDTSFCKYSKPNLYTLYKTAFDQKLKTSLNQCKSSICYIK